MALELQNLLQLRLKTFTDITTIYHFLSKVSWFLKFNSHQHIFSTYAGGHSFEEEANVHDEPFGYELGDDV